MFPRPCTRFDTCRKRSEVVCGNSTEGLAEIRIAMWNNVMAAGDQPVDVEGSGLKELDYGVGIVAVNGHSRTRFSCLLPKSSVK